MEEKKVIAIDDKIISSVENLTQSLLTSSAEMDVQVARNYTLSRSPTPEISPSTGSAETPTPGSQNL